MRCLYVYVKNWQLPNEFNTKNFMQYKIIHEHCMIWVTLFIYFLSFLFLLLDWHFSTNHLFIHNSITINTLVTVSINSHFCNSMTPLFITCMHYILWLNSNNPTFTIINTTTKYILNLNMLTATIPRHSVKSKNYCIILFNRWIRIGERKINCGGYR